MTLSEDIIIGDQETNAQKAETLREIQDEITDLLDIANSILIEGDNEGMIYERAQRGWIQSINEALPSDIGSLGCAVRPDLTTLQETIDEMFELPEEESEGD
ncbi:MAG: hypothetical protein KAS66_08365 [Candidatus Omnitrophica bacterium]|nr:hypothetical protein [Candidatus Omnitrophota bacterium]